MPHNDKDYTFTCPECNAADTSVSVLSYEAARWSIRKTADGLELDTYLQYQDSDPETITCNNCGADVTALFLNV